MMGAEIDDHFKTTVGVYDGKKPRALVGLKTRYAVEKWNDGWQAVSFHKSTSEEAIKEAERLNVKCRVVEITRRVVAIVETSK